MIYNNIFALFTYNNYILDHKYIMISYYEEILLQSKGTIAVEISSREVLECVLEVVATGHDPHTSGLKRAVTPSGWPHGQAIGHSDGVTKRRFPESVSNLVTFSMPNMRRITNSFFIEKIQRTRHVKKLLR